MNSPPTVLPRPHLSTSELASKLGIGPPSGDLVRIDEEALRRLVGHLRGRADFGAYQRYPWDDPRFWYPEGTPEQRSQYLTIGNAVNFRFWRLEVGEVVPAGGSLDGQRLTGAMYMWRCLRRCVDTGSLPILDASFLAELTAQHLDELFADDAGVNPFAVAGDDRLTNLRDLGQKLEAHWAGRFYNVVQASQGSLVEFVRLSQGFRAFDDPLLKLTMVNTILHLGSSLVHFDADPLPGIDYHLLKQLLRQGVLVPDPALARKLEQESLLTEEEGQGLRHAALWAFLEISAGTGLSGEILDNKWWWNRLKCHTVEPVCLDPRTAAECPFFGACAQRTELGMPLEETRYY